MPVRPDQSVPLTSRALARLAPLPQSFYSRDPRTVARELLGKLLIRRQDLPHPPGQSFGEPEDQLLLAGRIVEAEAYLGALDPGAHAYRGQTPRNAVLFGPPGHAYVYFVYGNHYCTNVGCHPLADAECNAGCVLLRALEPVCGIQQMAALRTLALPVAPRLAQLRLLTSGPGRLSQALGITRQRDNACDLCSPAGTLYIAADGSPAPPISATPRINVTRAPLEEWRFLIPGNPFVSGPRPR
jgi:DNA-3-methyladenine glycosylase